MAEELPLLQRKLGPNSSGNSDTMLSAAPLSGSATSATGEADGLVAAGPAPAQPSSGPAVAMAESSGNTLPTRLPLALPPAPAHSSPTHPPSHQDRSHTCPGESRPTSKAASGSVRPQQRSGEDELSAKSAADATIDARAASDLVSRTLPPFRRLFTPHVGTAVALDAAACDDAWPWMDQLGHEAQRMVELCLANDLVGLVIRESEQSDGNGCPEVQRQAGEAGGGAPPGQRQNGTTARGHDRHTMQPPNTRAQPPQQHSPMSRARSVPWVVVRFYVPAELTAQLFRGPPREQPARQHGSAEPVAHEAAVGEQKASPEEGPSAALARPESPAASGSQSRRYGAAPGTFLVAVETPREGSAATRSVSHHPPPAEAGGSTAKATSNGHLQCGRSGDGGRSTDTDGSAPPTQQRLLSREGLGLGWRQRSPRDPSSPLRSPRATTAPALWVDAVDDDAQCGRNCERGGAGDDAGHSARSAGAEVLSRSEKDWRHRARRGHGSISAPVEPSGEWSLPLSPRRPLAASQPPPVLSLGGGPNDRSHTRVLGSCDGDASGSLGANPLLLSLCDQSIGALSFTTSLPFAGTAQQAPPPRCMPAAASASRSPPAPTADAQLQPSTLAHRSFVRVLRSSPESTPLPSPPSRQHPEQRGELPASSSVGGSGAPHNMTTDRGSIQSISTSNRDADASGGGGGGGGTSRVEMYGGRLLDHHLPLITPLDESICGSRNTTLTPAPQPAQEATSSADGSGGTSNSRPAINSNSRRRQGTANDTRLSTPPATRVTQRGALCRPLWLSSTLATTASGSARDDSGRGRCRDCLGERAASRGGCCCCCNGDDDDGAVVTLRLPRACCVTLLQIELSATGMLLSVTQALAEPTMAALTSILSTLRHGTLPPWRRRGRRHRSRAVEDVCALASFHMGRLQGRHPPQPCVSPPPTTQCPDDGEEDGQQSQRSPTGVAVRIATALVAGDEVAAVRAVHEHLAQPSPFAVVGGASPLADHQVAYLFALARTRDFYQRWGERQRIWQQQQQQRQQWHWQQSALRNLAVHNKWESHSSRPESATAASPAMAGSATTMTATTAPTSVASSWTTAPLACVDGGHVEVLPLEGLLAATTFSEEEEGGGDAQRRWHCAVAQALSHPCFSPYPAMLPAQASERHAPGGGDGNHPARSTSRTRDVRARGLSEQGGAVGFPVGEDSATMMTTAAVEQWKGGSYSEEDTGTIPLIPLMMMSITDPGASGGGRTPAATSTVAMPTEAKPLVSSTAFRGNSTAAAPTQHQAVPDSSSSAVGAGNRRPSPAPTPLSVSTFPARPNTPPSLTPSTAFAPMESLGCHPYTLSLRSGASLRSPDARKPFVASSVSAGSEESPTAALYFRHEALARKRDQGRGTAVAATCEGRVPGPATSPDKKETVVAAEKAFAAVSASKESLKSQIRLSHASDVSVFGATPMEYSSRLLRLHTTQAAPKGAVLFREAVPIVMPLLLPCDSTASQMSVATDGAAPTATYATRNPLSLSAVVGIAARDQQGGGLPSHVMPSSLFCSNASEDDAPFLTTPRSAAGSAPEKALPPALPPAEGACPNMQAPPATAVSAGHAHGAAGPEVCHECGAAVLSAVLVRCRMSREEDADVAAHAGCDAVYCSHRCEHYAWHCHHYGVCSAAVGDGTRDGAQEGLAGQLLCTVRTAVRGCQEWEQRLLSTGTGGDGATTIGSSSGGGGGHQPHHTPRRIALSPYILLGIISVRLVVRIVLRSVAILCPDITMAAQTGKRHDPGGDEADMAVRREMAAMREAILAACSDGAPWRAAMNREDGDIAPSPQPHEQLLVAEHVLQAQGIPFLADTNLGRPLTVWEATRATPAFATADPSSPKRRDTPAAGPVPPPPHPHLMSGGTATVNKRQLLVTAATTVFAFLQCIGDAVDTLPSAPASVRLLSVFRCPRFIDQLWDFVVTSFCVIEGRAAHRGWGPRGGGREAEAAADSSADDMDTDGTSDRAHTSVARRAMAPDGSTVLSSSLLTDGTGTGTGAATLLSTSTTTAARRAWAPTVPMIVVSPYLSLTADLQQYSPESFYATRFFPEHAERSKAMVLTAGGGAPRYMSPRGQRPHSAGVGGEVFPPASPNTATAAEQSTSFLSIDSVSVSVTSAAALAQESSLGALSSCGGDGKSVGAFPSPPSCYFGQAHSAFTDALDTRGHNITVRLQRSGTAAVSSPFIAVARAKEDLVPGEILYAAIPVAPHW